MSTKAFPKFTLIFRNNLIKKHRQLVMHFSKFLENFGKIPIGLKLLLVVSSFLNTDVILASFIDDWNVSSANDLLNSSRRIGVK